MKNVLLIVFCLFLQLNYSQTFQKVKNFEKKEGYFNFFYNEKNDEIFLEVNNLNQEFLYLNSLAAGIGSNDIGLDRGQLGTRAVVKFIKAGNKLLLIQPNQKFRAISNNIEEEKSVGEAFAQSVLGGFKIEEEINGSFLINITNFIIRDAHQVADRLKSKKQGSFSLDKTKSALFLERTKAFPKNVEFEAILTFKGKATGKYLKSVAPNSSLITVRQHHSFIELPDANYKPRVYDPRSGLNFISYMDYATPIEESITKRYIVRHRLEKKNPNAKVSEAKEPIIYYLDRGAPEPVKSALLKGGSWWNQAFEAIGYKNAFQFKILPEGVDPLDVRYNVVQWVHRSTRGWSYGASVVDPRTGEIIKGHVSLGSLRIRQDYLIAQALIGTSKEKGADNKRLQMALARIRQLGAHEIGHTLGFAHNFSSSTNGRASVMDYPHPFIQLKNNKIDLSEAYDTNIGVWDKVTVAYAYQSFSKDLDEKKELNKIISNALDKGLNYLSDVDARHPGGASINAHLWDNGKSAGKELDRVLKVRDFAIKKFSENNFNSNEPHSVLEDTFVPLYFFHRYQVEAATKVIGGLEYSYAIKNDGQTIVKPVSAEVEKVALQNILKTLSVKTLKIPERILKLFPPRAKGFNRTRESFNIKTGVSFDALEAPATAANFTLNFLLKPERANRMVQQKALFPKNLSFESLIDQLVENSFEKTHTNNYDIEIQHSINTKILESFFKTYASQISSFQVKSIIKFKLKELKKWLNSYPSNISKMYAEGYIDLIQEFLENPSKYKVIETTKIPDGSPIGTTLKCDFN